MKILKFQIPENIIIGEFEIQMPESSFIMSFQLQDSIPCIWAACYPENELETLKFTLLWTGDEVPEHCKYVGTIQNSGFVRHLFFIPKIDYYSVFQQ